MTTYAVESGFVRSDSAARSALCQTSALVRDLVAWINHRSECPAADVKACHGHLVTARAAALQFAKAGLREEMPHDLKLELYALDGRS